MWNDGVFSSYTLDMILPYIFCLRWAVDFQNERWEQISPCVLNLKSAFQLSNFRIVLLFHYFMLLTYTSCRSRWLLQILGLIVSGVNRSHQVSSQMEIDEPTKWWTEIAKKYLKWRNMCISVPFGPNSSLVAMYIHNDQNVARWFSLHF